MANQKKIYNIEYKDFDRTYTSSSTSVIHNYQDLCFEFILASCTATTQAVSAITSTYTDVWHTVDFYVTRNDSRKSCVELKEREDNDCIDYPKTNYGEKDKLVRMMNIYYEKGIHPYITFIQSNGEVTSYDLAYIYENKLYTVLKDKWVQKNNTWGKKIMVKKDMVLYNKKDAFKKYKIKNWKEIKEKLKYRAENESENNYNSNAENE